MPEYVEISSPMCFWSEHVKALHKSTLIYNFIDLTNCRAFMYYVSNNCNKLYMSCWKPFVFILHERRIYLLVNPSSEKKQLRYNTELKRDSQKTHRRWDLHVFWHYTLSTFDLVGRDWFFSLCFIQRYECFCSGCRHYWLTQSTPLGHDPILLVFITGCQ
jgi:hypothetical protein